MSSRSKDKPLYLSVDLPDFRKRFIITYENVTLTFSIDPKLTFQGLVSIIVQRFRIDSTLKESVRIKTKDGRRLTSLNATYNNQLLDVTISTMSKGADQDDDAPTYSLRHSSSNNEPLPSQKFADPSYTSDSVFIEHCRQLQELLGKANVIVGESLPYCAHIFLGNENCAISCSLFFIDHPTYKDVGLTTNSVSIRASEDSLQDIVQVEVANMQNPTDMVKLVTSVAGVFNSYIAPFITPVPKLPVEIAEIFPTSFKTIPTITTVSFISQINALISKVSDDYDIPTSVAMNFLFKYKFNVSSLKKMLPKIDAYGCAQIEKHKFSNETGGECSICYCDIDDPIEFFCGHRFCRSCIGEYLVASINDGNGVVSPIRCCGTGCPVMIDHVTISLLIPERNSKHLRNMFVNDAASLTRSKWCPSNGCKRLFYPSQRHDFIPYTPCLCKSNNCTSCGKAELHWPSPCQHSFIQEDDFANYLWMAQNTTLCYQCKYPIQRNQGCNHMTCTKCNYQFCYVCGSKWGGSHYNCKSTNKRISQFTSQLTETDVGSSNLLTEYLLRGTNSNNKISVIYSNFIFHYKSTKNRLKKKIFEDLLYYLQESARKDVKPSDREMIISSLRNNIQKVYKILKETEAKKESTKPEYSRVRSLRCNVNINGTANDIGVFFIPSQINRLREDILASLQKAGIMAFQDLAQSQLVLFNQYGGQIKHAEEIMYNEILYVAPEGESFKEPPETVAEDSENNNDTVFNKKAALKKRDVPSASDANKKLDEDQLTEIANRLSDMLNISVEECYELVKKSGAISEVDAINSVLTLQIHNQGGNSDDENLQEVMTYEQLIELFPSFTEDIIQRALIESKDNIEMAADWLYDFEDKWMNNICENTDTNISPKSKTQNANYYDEDSDEDYDDPSYIYAKSKLTHEQSRYYD